MRESTGRSQERLRKGAVTIEATLLLPLFLIFWFGIVDWGITYYAHQSIVHNANVAARWAVVNAYNEAAIQNMVIYGSPTAPAGATSGMFGLKAGNVKVELLGSEITYDHRIVITVSGYTWTHFTPFFAGSYTGRPVVVSLPAEDLE